MSILEVRSLDTSQILMEALEIGDMVNHSRELHEYLYWKERLSGDNEANKAIRNFQQKKEKFQDCERFGHFHPDYHEALEQVRKAELELDKIESVHKFKQAEKALDDLLYTLAETIARSISEDIKVPSNDPLPKVGGCNCASGGGCSGSCG